MEYLKIRNWDRWQSYRKDRGQPPWIKLHRCLMRDPEWVGLTDSQRGQLVAIWLLAADRGGVIPASESAIKKLCYMDADPDINLFIKHGFIEHDANMAPTWRQHDQPETETETETETEKPLVRQKPNHTEIIQIFDFLNEKTGKRFQAKTPNGSLTTSGRLVQNLLKKGYTAEDIRMVCARKYREWNQNADMIQYLRPKTLFAPSNFDNYIGECV